MSIRFDWLNLIELSGPFLAEPVLNQAMPDGLDALERNVGPRLRSAYIEWRDAVDASDPLLGAIHSAWIDEVLTTGLDYDEQTLLRGEEAMIGLILKLSTDKTSRLPDMALVDPSKPTEPLLLIGVHEPDLDLDVTQKKDWNISTPKEAMVNALRKSGCPLGLVTNGEAWTLVHAPEGEITSFATWYSRMFGLERDTLRAFVSLLEFSRFTGPASESLPELFKTSKAHQGDVTEALGDQVADAIEVLMRALDRADQDRNRDLLADVEPTTLYEAGLTLMMRLVVILSAEERDLLLLGDPIYDANYAISSLRAQLSATDPEILERRNSAWSRLLATFRLVHAGVDHPDLRLPALGGSLFDPDRFPFLEGRKRGSTWQTEAAEPLPIDDRTVLLLLEAIQRFRGRTLSYRALDVEQIGHVYEGLLDQTADRVTGLTLQLKGASKAKTPLVKLEKLERLDEPERIKHLVEVTERSEGAIKSDLEKSPDASDQARLLTSCRADADLRDRILPYVHLIDVDPWGMPIVHHGGAIVIVRGTDRRESGSHYTPKSLTEKIVEETLTPVVYRGPAEGVDEADWELKSPAEILDLKICDPAMGSGAFLVQVCRWLSVKLVEAWGNSEERGGFVDAEGAVHESQEAVKDPMPLDIEERTIEARRLIAEKCLYGVDMNPMAVELAKLSLWLTTVAKGRPFGFLDHNLRSGNSLIGIDKTNQVIELNMKPKQKEQLGLFGRGIRSAVNEAIGLRKNLRSTPVIDIEDVKVMERLDSHSRQLLSLPTLIADAFLGSFLAYGNRSNFGGRVTEIAALSDNAIAGEQAAQNCLANIAGRNSLEDGMSEASTKPFHWPLEYPEVFSGELRGFDALVGNPPWGAIVSEDLKSWIKLQFKLVGDFETAMAFVERSIQILKPGGRLGLVLPNTVLLNNSAATLREYLSRNTKITRILDFTEHEIFGSATVRCCVVELSKLLSPAESFKFSRSPKSDPGSELRLPSVILSKRLHWASLDEEQVEIPSHLPKIGEVFFVKQGYKPYDKHALMKRMSEEDAAAIVKEKPWHSKNCEDSSYVRELKGKDVRPFEVLWSGLWASYGPWVSNYIPEEWFQGKRVLVREIVGSDPYPIVASVTNEEFVHNPSIICIKQKDGEHLLDLLELYLNSECAGKIIKTISSKVKKGVFPKVLVKDLRAMPFPHLDQIDEEALEGLRSLKAGIGTQLGKEKIENFIEGLLFQTKPNQSEVEAKSEKEKPKIEVFDSTESKTAKPDLFSFSSNKSSELRIAIVAHLESRPGWHSAMSVLDAVPMTEIEWKEAIGELVSEGLVTQKGTAPNFNFSISEAQKND
ncbi:Eco57I restriction-modification methylase domain-containing protein [Ruegeria arenilitoris]|uniref:Eco57I restriction-modification methylase domain-containing protein n=1 Tax=Ruegeria arenilitoris TaxID=1173585 RepID=UPI001479A83C|nr:N-6 DNA methylase [Ruegeria arenilitoris]